MEFSNVTNLNKYIVNAINDVIEDISEDMKLKLREKVREDYRSSVERGRSDYFAYTPTFELVESITRVKLDTKRNEIGVKVYFDPSEIHPKFRENEWWNAHMGFCGEDKKVYDNMSVSEWVPFWIEEGTKNGMYPRDGTKNVEETFNEYRTKLAKMIVDELKVRYGIKAKAN